MNRPWGYATAAVVALYLYGFIGDCVAMDRMRHRIYDRQPGWGR